jgi:predicted AAA+ superfamily ATPase
MQELLERWNPWWTDKTVPEKLIGIRREKYLNELFNQAKQRRISIVTGPKRAGKTTLLYQVIDSLISTGINPNNILYVHLDHPAIGQDIGEIIREFRRINKLDSKVFLYVFLDEAQYIKNWAQWAKAIHDSEEIKLFISGSTTALLEKDAYASLTGRWQKNLVWPLDFSEFLRFRDIQITGAERYLELSYLHDYLNSGGFPEAVLEESDLVRSRLLVDLFEDMVFKDAARTKNFRDIHSLRQIAIFMASAIGKPVSINKMRNTFKISSEAISNYIDALCSAYLFFPCTFYSKSINERTYNPKKYYIIDPGMTRAVLGTKNIGAAVENILAIHYHKKDDIWYWKSDAELDFVLGDARAAIESKFKTGIDQRSLRGGLKFSKKNKLKTLYVATEDYQSTQKINDINVIFVPITNILLHDEGP